MIKTIEELNQVIEKARDGYRSIFHQELDKLDFVTALQNKAKLAKEMFIADAVARLTPQECLYALTQLENEQARKETREGAPGVLAVDKKERPLPNPPPRPASKGRSKQPRVANPGL